MIGDQASDMEAARRIRALGLLVAGDGSAIARADGQHFSYIAGPFGSDPVAWRAAVLAF